MQLELKCLPSLRIRRRRCGVVLKLGCEARCCSLLLAVAHHTMPACAYQIANLVQKVSDAKVAPLDAQTLLQGVAQQPGAFLTYRLDAQGCLEAVVWALPESKPCNCTAKSGFKTIPARHWQPIAHPLPLLASIATAGMLFHFAYVQSAHVLSFTVKNTCYTTLAGPDCWCKVC